MTARRAASLLAVFLVGALVWAAWRWQPDAPAPASTATSSPPLASPTGSADARTARVVWIADGDTLDVDLAGTRTRVRLINIDAPELAHDGVAAQCLAGEASAALGRLAPVGTQLRLSTYGQDRYGRLLAAAHLPDGRLANAEVVRLGLAGPLVVSGQTPLLDAIRVAQADAAAVGVGLHGSAPCSLPARVAAARATLDAVPHDPLMEGRDAARATLRAVAAEASELTAELHADARDALVQGLTDAEYARVDAATADLARDAAALAARLG